MNTSPGTAALFPAGENTAMLCDPVCAGETALIWVEETTVKLVAASEPKPTRVAPVKLVPVMVTVVPPVDGPEVGEIEVIVGAVEP